MVLKKLFKFWAWKDCPNVNKLPLRVTLFSRTGKMFFSNQIRVSKARHSAPLDTWVEHLGRGIRTHPT